MPITIMIVIMAMVSRINANRNRYDPWIVIGRIISVVIGWSIRYICRGIHILYDGC